MPTHSAIQQSTEEPPNAFTLTYGQTRRLQPLPAELTGRIQANPKD